MKEINATIKNIRVRLVVVEVGEKVSQIRKQLGLEIGEFSTTWLRGVNADYESNEEYAYFEPEMYQLLTQQFGIDLADAVGIIEVQEK